MRSHPFGKLRDVLSLMDELCNLRIKFSVRSRRVTRHELPSCFSDCIVRRVTTSLINAAPDEEPDSNAMPPLMSRKGKASPPTWGTTSSP